MGKNEARICKIKLKQGLFHGIVVYSQKNKNFMLEKKIISVLLSVLPLTGFAQMVDSSVRGYNVYYEKEHLFLQKDSGFNVVDYDLEWPDIVSFSDVKPLKNFISSMLFNEGHASLDSVLMSVKSLYGKPVTGPLKTIPDDNRFCYVTASARIVSYSPNRWIAYDLVDNVEPQKLSEFKPSKAHRVIVYDIARDQILSANDMLRPSILKMSEPDDFYDKLFEPLDDDSYNDMQRCQINGVWLDGGMINLYVDVTTSVTEITYPVSLPYEEYSYILSRDARRLVGKVPKTFQPQMLKLPLTLDGDTIYNKVEVMPQFKGGDEALRKYMSSLTKPNYRLDKNVKVYVSFVVDKKGNVRDVSVISPVNPILDCHAAEAVKGMPAFVPGSHNGQPVCVRMIQPIAYNVQ